MQRSIRPNRIVLIGMMGSGKSTVGRALTARTGWPYLDNDDLLHQTTGQTARELLARGGEAALRAGEADVVRRALAEPAPLIVGVAAGVVLDKAARSALRRADGVVWLRARPATLAARLGRVDHRPFMEGDVQAWLERTAADREPLFLDVADLVVDVDDRSPAEIARHISAELHLGNGASPARA